MKPSSIVMREEDFTPNKESCGCCGGWSHSSNRLLRCSLCNVAVHKHCYGVDVVNEHGWKCSPCSEGLNSDGITCVVCKKKGGSIKRIVRGGKGWIHILCAVWIPDTYFLDPMGVDGICLDAVDPDRYKLRCCICGNRGMCMQCHGTRCLVAYHPWCMFSAGHKCYPRVVTVGDAVTPETLCFSSYCPKHIKMCPVPYDPPPQPQNDKEAMEWMDRKSKSSVCGFSKTGEGNHYSSHDREGSMSPELLQGFNSASDHALLAESSQYQGSPNSKNGYYFQSKLSGRTSPPMFKNMFTFQQWPGHQLGHDMDLEHFWSVVGSYYPESHPDTWLKASLNAIDKLIPKVGVNSEFSVVVPAIGGQQRCLLEEGKEQLQNEEGGGVMSEQNNMLNRGMHNRAPVASLNHQKGLVTVCIENGCYRASCLFELYNGGGVKSEIQPVLLNSSSDLGDLDHHHVKQERTNAPGGGLRDLHIDLTEFICMRTPAGPPLGGSSAADNEIEICQELHFMQKQLRDVLQSVKQLLEPAKESARYHASKAHDIQKHWNSVLNRYQQMKAWKAVVVMLVSGNRDRKSGFNKHMEEEIPASWRMIVKGRPAVPSPSKVMNPADEADSLCSVCFDGSAPADNHIVFCDGCNIGLHQCCYGLKGIPEFEFYCDRCVFLQSQVRRINSSIKIDLTIPGLVQPPGAPQLPVPRCALCPMLHGGLKQTEDGRWVHLCCALWVPGVHIGKIANMESISLASIQLQSSESCIFCKHMIGALLSCKGEREDGQPCGQKFHYLCAWFAGCVMDARIPPGTDLSSGFTDGYPCSVELHCLCMDHSTHQRAVEEQKSLRANYRMVTEPPAMMTGFKKPRKQRSTGGRGGKRALKPVTELYPDSYTSYPCSACIVPAGTVTGLLGVDITENKVDVDDDPVVCCRVCGITVHLMCYDGGAKARENMEPESSWSCDACSKGLHYPKCGLCPRRGGAFFSTSRSSHSLAPMVHCYCADHTPGAAVITTSHEKTPCVNLMAVPSDLRGKHACVLCHHKQGVCVKCAHHGCMLYFHPLCARHYGLYSNPYPPSELSRRWPFKYAHYCQKHTPDGVFRLSNEYFVDAWAAYKLRQDLDRVRLIIDLVRKREKVKRALWRTVCAHFEACMDQVRGEVRKQQVDNDNDPRLRRHRNLEVAALEGGESPTTGKKKGDKGSSTESSDNVKEEDGDSSSSNSEGAESEKEGSGEFPSEAVFDLFRPYGHRLDGSPWDDGQRILEEQQSKEETELQAKKGHELRNVEANKARELRRQFRGDFDQILLRCKRTVTFENNNDSPHHRKTSSVDDDTTRFPGWWNGVVDLSKQPQQDFSVTLERLAGYSALSRARKMLPSEKVPSISDDPIRVKLDRQLKAVVDAIVESQVPIMKKKKSKPYGRRGSTNDNDDDDDSEPQWQTLNDSGDHRLLSEMFMHVPTEDEYPEYWELIKEPVDTDSMFRKVQEFCYDSLEELLEEMKQLVDNARILGRHVVLNDAIRLHAVTNKAYKEVTKDVKKRLLPSPTVVGRGRGGALTRNRRCKQEVVEGSNTKAGTRKRSRRGEEMVSSSTAEEQHICSTCGSCCILSGSNSNNNLLEQMEQRFPLSSGEKHCELCLNQHATSFIGRRVWVLWPQDQKWYKGRIQAYDPSSGKHRVIYDDDGEWEFLHLSDIYMLWLSNECDKDPRHPPRIPGIHKLSKKSRRNGVETSWKQWETTEKPSARSKDNQKAVVVDHPKRNAACSISKGTTKSIGTTVPLRTRRGGGTQRQQEPSSQMHKKQAAYKTRNGGKMVKKVIVNPLKDAASSQKKKGSRNNSSKKRMGGDGTEDEDYKDLNCNDDKEKIRAKTSSTRPTRSCRTRISASQSSSHSGSKPITPRRRIRFIHKSS